MGKRWDDPGAFVERRPDRSVKFDKVGGNHNPCNPQDAVRTARSENQKQQAWHEAWAREAIRVLRPGGFLLAFGGTRTVHRLTCAIEDAGFEIRDCITWHYGQGFPKSANISKHIDRMAGAEREVVGSKPNLPGLHRSRAAANHFTDDNWEGSDDKARAITAAATDEAKQWEGWGTALKPATEFICVARKPLSESSVARNVLKWGTGGLNIDASRVGTADLNHEYQRKDFAGMGYGGAAAKHEVHDPGKVGRFPSNLLLSHHPLCRPVGVGRVKGITGGTGNHDGSVYGRRTNQGQKVKDYADPDGFEQVAKWECARDEGGELICPVALMDQGAGPSSVTGKRKTFEKPGSNWGVFGGQAKKRSNSEYTDSGGPSRFFASFPGEWGAYYCAKSSKAEREAGLQDIPAVSRANGNKWTDQDYRVARGERTAERESGPRSNTHPCVKPIKLMKYLLTLVVPPNGVALDPFAGSGSTLVAAAELNINAVGIEQDASYCEIARRRVEHALEQQEESPEPTLFEARHQ